MIEILFDQEEITKVRHVGFIVGGTRFDFTITNSQHFFGKKIVTCLQSNRSAILDLHDVNMQETLTTFFNLSMEDAGHLANLLEDPLGDQLLHSQY